ncbi:efflux transporter outer membrane subunit [Rhodoferax sp.]|uniref:efflux transporter outer membrane subunit n=1 Tax=Rhodoferax sp. TaxID=50421 RepID=UPI0027316548|nr:efflux transporter outer membrane subunit [Rhodoferax sp.]MDP1528055.1 efflux transporter outer membrane subunit [Rhodoferax sp.]MDP1944056.1 efflux transporter outer membrane subunit [Rhodoferax sp.]MDP2442544.1 efflux transporter outer membrane subunit [Rhodoferax sp.]MDZ4207758.1 efflux transporter outer membrane subunit [Rhodoferax sp.]
MNKQQRSSASTLKRSVAVLAISLLTGCSLMPTYQRPSAPVAAQWPASAGVNTADSSASATPQAVANWQSYFSDPALRQLIDTALANNRDLRVALLNIDQARAQLGVRRADQLPTLNTAAAGSRAPGSDGAINSTYSAGLTVTAYELDFFGRVASLKEQALAQVLASAEAAQTVQISLIATVAQTWLNLLADEELLAVSRRALNSRAESLKLVDLKVEHGAASDFERRNAQTLLESARVTLAQHMRQRALDENALALLLGQPVSAAQREQWTPHKLSQLMFAELPAGLPSDLLARRPDIRQAEQSLVASNANIGAARAAFFPRISLTAGAGSASSALSGLFKSGSWGWTLAPQLVLPIFDAGRNQANLDAARTGREIAVAQYEKAIQSAFREVADGLASRATLVEQLQAQQALLDAETARSQLTQLRLEHGVANQLDWLDAQRALFSAQQALVQTRLASLQNQIALFKTLGGGMEAATGL